MSDTPVIYSQFGPALGLAERTLSTVLRKHLAQRDTIPEVWYTLRLLVTRGPPTPGPTSSGCSEPQLRRQRRPRLAGPPRGRRSHSRRRPTRPDPRR